MADSRRVQLTTLPPGPVPSEPAPKPRKSPTAGPRAEVGRPDPGTVRMELALFEADERSSPEFSYSRLVDSKINCTQEKVPLIRFEEEEMRETDEVAAMSRKLENLYGGNPKKQQQQQQQKEDRIQDLIDIGFGYDDEDSFIDNSEAYDEFVPASITTRFGGFYVNSGVLHFRQVSETEEPEELATDEETPESPKVNGGHDKPKKKRRTDGAVVREAESSALSENGPDATTMKKRKKKMAAGPLSVTSMLKKFQREKENERQKMAKAPQKSAAVVPVIVLVPADAGGAGGVPGLTDPLLSLIGSTDDHALIQAANAVDFDIDLDSLLDDTEQSQPAAEAPLFRSKADDPVEAAAPLVRPPDPETGVRPPPPPGAPASASQCVVPLPEGLSPRLEVSIRKLLAVIKTSAGEKLKFFTPEINSALLDIEVQCREQGVQLRSKVYTHLSAFLPCSRDTLLKRVKKLFLAHTEEPPDVDDPLQKLKEAVGRAMPEQTASFRESCRLHELGRTSRATEEEMVEENLEEKGGRRAGGGGGGGGPKKSFKWNEEIRRGLCEVLRVRMESYSTRGSQEMELQLKSLLDNEVQPLWPKGWMQCRVLLRESRKMLSLFTPPPVKPARLEKRSAWGPPLQGPPPPKGLRKEADDVIIVSSSFAGAAPLCAEKKEEAAASALKRPEVAADAVSRTPAEADRPPVKAAPAPAQQSLLDLLADQALARVQPHMASQELLAAAVAKYKRSVRHWSFGADAKSPPLPPPPPPQSSPVDFPLTHAPPPLLPVGDFARHMDASHVLIISDDDDVAA